MVGAVLSGFAAAALAPWVHKRTPRFAGWILCAVPLALTLWLAHHLPAIARGETFQAQIDWVPALGIRLSFYLDGLGLLMGLLVCGIGTLVMIYAGGYLKGQADLGRFLSFTLFFMASMLGVVLADNLVALFIFWELTSFSSYLLIGFDSRRAEARAAALQALLVTGSGGLFLLAGLILLGEAGGSYELSALFAGGFTMAGHPLYVPAALLILLGAFTKSAQFPFHFWLPRAMEAPAPASAYLHSATMVKAGVYLIARMSPVMGTGALWGPLVTGVGAVTMVLAACMALGQARLKPMLAYSTVSALGAMTMLLGAGTAPAFKAAMAFLLAHAFYKAALFLVAGAIDHGTGETAVDKLGGLRRVMPATAVAAGVAALSMAGIPPLFGFVAKEAMLETTLSLTQGGAWLTAAVMLSGMLFLAVAWLTGVRPFIGALRETPHEPHAPGASLQAGPVVLGALALTAGLLPGLFGKGLIGPAASAIAGEAVAVKLQLWHGFNLALLLSALTVAGGAAVVWLRPVLLRRTAPLRRLGAWGPERAYTGGLTALNAVARFQTGLLQNGHLRYYVTTIVVTTIALVGYTLWSRAPGVPPPSVSLDVRYYEVALVLVIALAAVLAMVTLSRLAAVAALGVVGYGVALIFVLFGAPDLAMTQFVIETLTLVLLVLAFHHLPSFKNLTTRGEKVRDLLVAGAGGAMMSVLVLYTLLPPFHPTISSYFADHAAAEAHGRNIVNVILVDFRALDTMGEITVLALAGLGGFALLKFRGRKEAKS